MHYVKDNPKTVSSGIGFIGLLTIAFIILKLCKVIDWSWIIVLLAPIWIPVSVILLISLVVLIIYFIGIVIEAIAAIGKKDY